MENDRFDMNTGQAHEFVLACRRNGLTKADLKLLCMGKNLSEFIKLLRGREEVSKVFGSNVIQIPLNYNIFELIRKGRYHCVDERFTSENFHDVLELIGDWNYELIKLDSQSYEKAFDECNKDGWIPAQLAHILMLGIEFPDKQMCKDILALGSHCQGGDGNKIIPLLCSDGFNRELSLVNIDFYNKDVCYMRVRRVTTP